MAFFDNASARARLFPQGETYHRGIDKSPVQADCLLCSEEAFREVMDREAARVSRSGSPFLLILFDVSVYGSAAMTWQIASALSSSTREIDMKGWYTDDAVLGILFTEFGKMHNSSESVEEVILTRLRKTLSAILSTEEMLRMKVTSYFLLPGETVRSATQVRRAR